MNILSIKKAYSLVELLVAMAVIGILLIMFSQLTISFITLSHDNYVRNKFREGLTDVMDAIKRDIRNADQIDTCEDSTCTITHASKVIWQICDDDLEAICKVDAATFDVIKKTADNIFVKALTFEMIPVGGDDNGTLSNASILVTIEAIPLGSEEDREKARQDELFIDVRQIIVSTRNARL
jgi:prepilin-type N-terminal cleavage/methylation domain-containing protein